jgi:hypothetical protein
MVAAALGDGLRCRCRCLAARASVIIPLGCRFILVEGEDNRRRARGCLKFVAVSLADASCVCRIGRRRCRVGACSPSRCWRQQPGTTLFHLIGCGPSPRGPSRLLLQPEWEPPQRWLMPSKADDQAWRSQRGPKGASGIARCAKNRTVLRRATTVSPRLKCPLPVLGSQNRY